MRKYVGLIFGVACLAGGAWAFYSLFFEAETIHFMFVFMAALLVAVGVAGLVDTWRHWRQP